MYSPKNLLTKKPTEIAGAVITLVNLSSIVGWVTLSADAVAGLNIALLSVLGLFVASSVTSNSSLAELSEVKDEAKAKGVAAGIEMTTPSVRVGGAAAVPTGIKDSDYPPTQTE